MMCLRNDAVGEDRLVPEPKKRGEHGGNSRIARWLAFALLAWAWAGAAPAQMPTPTPEPVKEAPSMPVPADQAVGVPVQSNLDWADSTWAAAYDLYVWRVSECHPDFPTVEGLGQSFYNPLNDFKTETTYNWQVVAWDADDVVPGPVWQFSTGKTGHFSPVAWISVTAPRIETVWEKESTQRVCWRSGWVLGNVKLFVSLDGGPWTSIAYDIPNSGSFNWTIHCATSTQARIRVTSMYNNSLYGQSGPFTIRAAPGITVLAPASGANWERGSTQTIRWTSGMAGNVKIFYSLDGGPWTSIANDVATSGSFNWMVDAAPSTQAKIRVTSMLSNSVYGESGPFTISPGNPSQTITVLDPGAGAAWQKGATQTVRWASSNIPGNVKLFVSLDGGAWNSIGTDVANSGMFSWEIKSGPSDNARLRITSMNNNAAYGESGPFTIGPGGASITVSQPAGGVVWNRGTTQTIGWSSERVAGNVKIYVSLDWGPWTLVAWDTPNDGEHAWSIPAAPGSQWGLPSQARIRITSMQSNILYGESGIFLVQ